MNFPVINNEKFSRVYSGLTKQKKSNAPIYLDKAVKLFKDSSLTFPNRDCATRLRKDGKRDELLERIKSALRALQIDIDEHERIGELFDKFEKVINELLEIGIIAEYYVYIDERSLDESSYELRSFYLTKEGIDLLLKIQAHEDSERRHKDNQRSTKVSTWVACSAVIISIVSTIATFIISSSNIKNQNLRIEQATEQLEISNKQLELANKRFGLLQQQVENSKTKEKE